MPADGTKAALTPAGTVRLDHGHRQSVRPKSLLSVLNESIHSRGHGPVSVKPVPDDTSPEGSRSDQECDCTVTDYLLKLFVSSASSLLS